MSTTSTIAVARNALQIQIDTGALEGNVHYAWPGPVAEKNEICWIDRIVPGSWTAEIPNIKAGRVQRQEAYTFEVVLWVTKPEEDADGAKTVFDRAVALAAVIEDAVADDVQLGNSNIGWTMISDRDIDLVPQDRGWGCQVILRIEGNARLT